MFVCLLKCDAVFLAVIPVIISLPKRYSFFEQNNITVILILAISPRSWLGRDEYSRWELVVLIVCVKTSEVNCSSGRVSMGIVEILFEQFSLVGIWVESE